jgi:hypothetical protein
MDIQINLIAVLLAATVSGIFGWLFYLPASLGKFWIRLGQIDTSKLNSKFALITAAISLVFMSFALAAFAYVVHNFLNRTFLEDTLLTAVVVFVGFQAFRMLQLAEFNQRPRAETLLHILNELITIMIMAFIIGLFGYA